MRNATFPVSLLLLVLIAPKGAIVSRSQVIRNEKAKLLRGLQLLDRPTDPIGGSFLRGQRAIEEDRANEIGAVAHNLQPKSANGYCLTVDGDVPLSNCFPFGFDNSASVIQAYLTLHLRSKLRPENVSISVYEVVSWGGEMSRLEHLVLSPSREDESDLSIRIDMIDVVRAWVDRASRPLDKLIKIDAWVDDHVVEFSEAFREVPIIEMVSGIKEKRDGRHCDQSSPCCLVSFYVNFTEIGWHDWILSPPGYYANYCVGVCPYNEDTDTQAVLRGAHSNDSAVFIPQPECAPLQYAPLTMIYAVGPHEFRKTTLHGMRAIRCSCFSH